MNEQFTDYETAKRLKELGMDEICIGFFNPSYTEMGGSLLFSNNGGDFDNWNKKEHLISAPLWQQVEQWLFDEHKVSINSEAIGESNVRFKCRVYIERPDMLELIAYTHHNSPIQAKNEGIKKAVGYLHEHSPNYALKK